MNTPHPLDETLVDLETVKRRLLRHFLHDNVLDAEERTLLEAINDEHDELVDYRRRQLAAQSLERNGFTKRTRTAFRQSGHDLINLDAERRKRGANVIELFPNDRSAG